jgi:hypothetical protein
MVAIQEKCAACGKFVVPAEHKHRVKNSQADRVCGCARERPPAQVVVERVVVKESFWVKAIAIGLLLAGVGWFVSNEIAKHGAEEAAFRRSVFKLMDAGLSKETAESIARGARALDRNF